jgi:hypothetical protein
MVNYAVAADSAFAPITISASALARDWIVSYPHPGLIIASHNRRSQSPATYDETRYGWAEIQALRAFERMD